MTKKTSRPIYPNLGIRNKFKKRIKKLTRLMKRSVMYWVKAGYRANPPKVAILSEDAAPSDEMQKVLDKLTRQWLGNFDNYGNMALKDFVESMFHTSQLSLFQALQLAGFTVKQKTTAAMKDAIAAAIQENIQLIKSIPQDYLNEVQGVVMRGYTRGRDLQYIERELNKIYPGVEDWVKLIARDQSNKLTSVASRTQHMELGLYKAEWMHSHAGKKPRPEHVAVDRKEFDLREGMYILGKWTFPGEEINCRCTYRVLLDDLLQLGGEL